MAEHGADVRTAVSRNKSPRVGPSRFRVAQLVREHYDEYGVGVTREELAEMIDWPQTKNLPGVRRAIADGLIRYDGSRAGRLIPTVVNRG